MRSWGKLVLCVGTCVLAAGCPKTTQQYNAGQKAENIQDYDSALAYYQKALAGDPRNASLRIRVDQMRFEAGESHIKKGLALREKGDLQGAAAEFQRASTIDPSSPVALQEFRRTLDQINELAHKQDQQAIDMVDSGSDSELASSAPELKPLPNTSISLKMTNDVKIIFDTIGKLAGITITYDPDLPARRISVDLNNLTLQQALDIVCLQSKTFFKPITENIIFVAQETTQKHKDYDEQLVETFYLANTVQSQDLTEITNGLRQVLNLTKVQQLNSQNAIIVRDTADKLAIARKLLKDIDKAKPEVVIQVEVLSASTDRLRDLGILPGQSASINFQTPGTTTTPSTGGSTTPTTPNSIPLKGFSFGAADYNVTLPGATANFLLTDTATKIIQNPEIRSIDGQPAKLNVGSRVPIATGSFQAGVGVGTTSVNPLVNTQFTYLDVGVNVNITPRVHPNHEVSLKVSIEVSQVNSFQTIGGIQQPVIGQRKIEHDIRLREGEVNILGGLFEKIDSKTVNGWPGFAQIPFIKYLTADNNNHQTENDVLIVLIPRIVRMPDWTRANLRPISTGVEQNITTRRDRDIRTPTAVPPQQVPAQQTPAAQVPVQQSPAAGTTSDQTAGANVQGARLRFDPQTVSLAPGQTTTLGISVDNVADLYSIPMILQFDPTVISVQDVQHGGFLSSGNQEIAIVKGGDESKGQLMIAATREPNTPGVSGSGTLLGLVVKALKPGNTNLSIVQVNAKDSQQKPLALITGEATIQVKQ